MCGLNLSYNCFSIPIVVINICQVVLQAIELFLHFILSCYFLDSEFYILYIHTLNIEKYSTFCDSYVQPNTYAVTYCAVYNRLLVHILNDRWSSKWMHTYKVIIECELQYYYKIDAFAHFRFWNYHQRKEFFKLHAVWIEN